MKKILISFMFILLLTLSTGCSNKINLSEDLTEIENIAVDLIKDDYPGRCGDMKTELLNDSIKVHEITEIKNNVYVLYSYHYKILGYSQESGKKDSEFMEEYGFMKNRDYYGVYLRVIKKDNSKFGYKLTGGGGGGGDIQTTAITVHGSGSKMYGLIQDPKVSKIVVNYPDGTSISQDTSGKDYYLIYRTDDEESKFGEITAYDKEGNILFGDDD